ncbi:Possible acyl protein synthase/acyl-CoA reductase-like protein [hydrothermal vent metagenome]|uniref:Possible acyl protein synthase/acyl-CoA reductase-like protein n=1 Tax=hydrothermal vent metagenome TaxID=652676 RepID=A0A3B0U817_9ZZZZ
MQHKTTYLKRMQDAKSLLNLLPNINEYNFEPNALQIFRWQATKNLVYKSYLRHLNVDVAEVCKLGQIPFLPISFFKSHTIKTNEWEPEKVFESSGTSGMQTSKHFIKDVQFYHTHAKRLFEAEFGSIEKAHILALLPSYLERDSSSLVSMVQFFIQNSNSSHSGFYLHNLEQLANKLIELKYSDRKIILFGVTFALLKLTEKYELDLSHVILIETGGMKGKREEVTREELYYKLRKKLNLVDIYSEYGMTELLSQAYGRNAMFTVPNSMKILIREVSDPFSEVPIGRTGGINVIDLANVHTCSFIETQDLGRLNADGMFEVLGRFDNSELRGCNLLVS